MKNIEEIRKKVEAIADGCGMGIDQKIKELVIGLMVNGIKTEQSCEGHNNHGASYPWVDIPTEQAVELAELVARQNRPTLMNGRENHNIWVVRPGCSLRLIPEDRSKSLEEMQDDAMQFGLFLQELLKE